ncbi:hypothetical protein D3C81_1583010 [compost metagenome]
MAEHPTRRGAGCGRRSRAVLPAVHRLFHAAPGARDHGPGRGRRQPAMAVHRHLHSHADLPAAVRLAGLQGAPAADPALDLRFFCQQLVAVCAAVCQRTRRFVECAGVLHLVVGVQPADHLAGLERADRPVLHRARQAPVRTAGSRGQPGRLERAGTGYAAGRPAGARRAGLAGRSVFTGQHYRCRVPAALA